MKTVTLTLMLLLLPGYAAAQDSPGRCRKDAGRDKRECLTVCRHEHRAAKLGCFTGGDEAIKQCVLDCANTFDTCAESGADDSAECSENCRQIFRDSFNACDDNLQAPCWQNQDCLLCRNSALAARNDCLTGCRENRRASKITAGCLTALRSCVNQCKAE